MTTKPDRAPAKASRHDSTRYIVGTGCVAITGDAAKDRLGADGAARAEVAKQIEVKIVQLAEDVQKEERKDDQVHQSHVVSVKTQEVVENTLKGIEITDRKVMKEEGMQCSVAVLDKAEMASRIHEEIEKILGEVNGYLSAAGEGIRRGEPAASLREYTFAMQSLNRAAVETGLIRDLGYRPPDLPSRVDLWTRWINTLENINILPAGGDQQKGRNGEPLPEPFKVRAVYEDSAPVPGLPLKVLRAPEGCELQREGLTDNRGEAVFRVIRVVSRGKAIEEVAIGIDWPRLLKTKGSAPESVATGGWEAREAVLTYRLPASGEFCVGVAVFEAGTGRPLARSSIQTALLEGLQKAGFRTQDVFSMSGGIAQAFQRKPTIEEARSALSGKMDILLLVDVSVTPASRSSYDFLFSRARGTIQGISLSQGRVLATIDAEEKGGGLNEDQAVKKAVLNLAKELLEQIGPTLERSLE
jgi:hypothetical protein